MEKQLHLDSEYRNRWVEFHLVDGTIEDSRQKNWRQVKWSRVVKVAAQLLGHVHEVDCTGQWFKAFMNFRWAGQEAMYDGSKKYVGHRAIKIWTIGWTDGYNCFLKDIDFYTGRLIKDYVSLLSNFKGHLHPDVKDKILGICYA
jgi:hypothetical protein